MKNILLLIAFCLIYTGHGCLTLVDPCQQFPLEITTYCKTRCNLLKNRINTPVEKQKCNIHGGGKLKVEVGGGRRQKFWLAKYDRKTGKDDDTLVLS